MKRIRHLFYTYRNGVVADVLKRAGDPHEIIFGLQLPQLGQIAKEVGEDFDPENRMSLAEELWSEYNCRESRLLAPYFFDPERLSMEKALNLLDECRTREETDILVFRCLRNHKDASAIRDSREGSYSAEALSRFL